MKESQKKKMQKTALFQKIWKKYDRASEAIYVNFYKEYLEDVLKVNPQQFCKIVFQSVLGEDSVKIKS